MKIIGLEAENFKRLRAVEIRPTGNLVKITGRNEQGKSSVIDAIWAALGGKDASPREPIRKGEDSAHVMLTLSDGMIVRRRWWRAQDGETKSDLRVETAEGKRPYGPQTVLDRLLGPLTLDPLEFARMDDKRRVDALKALVPGFDFAKLEADNRRDYEERTAIARLANRAQAAADSIKLPDGPEPEAADLTALAERLNVAVAQNAVTEQRRRRRQETADSAAMLRADAKNKREEARRLEVAATESDDIAAQMEQQLADADPLPEIVDVIEIQQKMLSAEQTNAEAAKFRMKAEHEREADRLATEALKLTEQIEARTEAKQKAIAGSSLGVPGLDFTEDKNGSPVVLLEGVPFDQASDAERLRASLAVAMAGKPKLRIIRCKDGSLLDQTSLAIVSEMAGDEDFQVWIEIVRDDASVGVHIEDGAIDAIEGKRQSPN